MQNIIPFIFIPSLSPMNEEVTMPESYPSKKEYIRSRSHGRTFGAFLHLLET